MSDTPDIAPQSSAPGQMLKHARESKNLTVAAIATLLNLDLRTVEALERDEQDKLPAPIFVRGYLRGYARLVGVSEAAVLEAYKVHAPQDPLPRSVGMSRVPMRPAFRAQMIPWKGVLLALFALGIVWLGVQWWPEIDARMRGEEAPAVDALVEPDAQETDQTSAESADTGFSGLPDFLESVPQADSGAIELTLPAPQSVPMTDAPQPSSQAEPELPTDTDFAATTPEVAEASPAAPGDMRVELRVSSESWVEVRDVNAKPLVVGLLRKGDTRTVTGKAPLSVVLGNAAGVEIQVDGKTFEHLRYATDNIARFEIKP